MWGNVTVLSGPLWEGKEVTRNWSWSGQFSPGTESRQVRQRSHYHLNNRCLTVSLSPPVGVTTFSINASDNESYYSASKHFKFWNISYKIFTKNIFFSPMNENIAESCMREDQMYVGVFWSGLNIWSSLYCPAGRSMQNIKLSSLRVR